MRKLILTQSFVSDLQDIRDYLTSKSPQAALGVVRSVFRTANELTAYPWLGHRRTDVVDPTLLFVERKRYTIAYRMNEQVVVVLRVVHSSRNFTTIRFD